MSRDDHSRNDKEQAKAAPAGQPAAAPPQKTEAPTGSGEPDKDKPSKPDELAVLTDKYLRLQADFDNFRKRTIRDRDEHNRRATETLLEDLLPVLDHLEMGLEAARKQHVRHGVIDGFGAVADQLRGVLAKAGVAEIDAAGKLFDPHSHECVAHAPSEEHPENTVLNVARRGYKLGSYLLRAAQVVVAGGADKPHADDKNHRHHAGESQATTPQADVD